jgi:hypothetical protein
MSAKKIEYLENHKPANTAVVGYDASRYNAVKHGVYSQYTVMHWENREDYNALFNSLMIEHNPQGITEAHLVEELAGSIWRKIRLRHAKMASLQSSLERSVKYDDNDSAKAALLANSSQIEDFDTRTIVLSSQEDNQQELAQTKRYLKCCLVAGQILSKTNSYEEGLAALYKNDQDEWQNEWLNNSCTNDEEYEGDENDEEEVKYSATVESLMSYVNIAKKHYEKLIYELTNREKVKSQALGKAFFSDKELNKYTKYENHLDKKRLYLLSYISAIND